MDIQADINWIHQEIDKVKDPSFIEKLKHLLQSKKADTIISDIDYNIDIEKALDSIKNGNFYSEEEAKDISKKWGRK
jgi:DNA modification methylase